MTGKLFVKPAVEGAVVLQPDRDMAPLPAKGDYVPASFFWHARLLAGDVVETPPPESPQEPQQEPPAAA
jgi:hypothetical protein